MTNIVLLRPKMNFPEAYPNPPIGLGYLASILRDHGHQVHLIDCAISKETYSQIIARVKRLNPDVVGITALSAYYSEMRILARMLQLSDIPIILGGVHATALPQLSLRECRADFAVIGEGEITTLELINYWSSREERKNIKGIAYIEKDQFKINPRRELIQNLDEIPFPAWDLINPSKYPPEPHGLKMIHVPVAPILTTRGCPYCCSYCASTNFWGNTFRRRSPQNVVDEIEFLVQKFGIREIHIWDDNFTLVKKHVIGICREILKRKLDLTFACPNGVRIDRLDRELLTIMKKTGFYSLTFSIESAVQEILDRANKIIDLKIIPRMAREAKHLGYFLPGFFIFGLPGETYMTARQSIEFAKSLPLDAIVCLIASPLPGSRLFEEWVQQKGISQINDGWFQFYVEKNKLELSADNKKLRLPIDAYREFYLRPRQILRYIKYNARTFHIDQIFPIIRRMYHLILKL